MTEQSNLETDGPPLVIEDREGHNFRLQINAEEAASAFYRADGDRLILVHTEVPYAYSGAGIGSALARGVFENARATGRKLVLRCPFMARFFARHPDFADVVAG